MEHLLLLAVIAVYALIVFAFVLLGGSIPLWLYLLLIGVLIAALIVTLALLIHLLLRALAGEV